MALVPYSITALAESDADGTSGKNIVAGAVVQFYDAASGGSAQTLYDDAASSNPSTSKTTDSQGQVTIYIEQGAYWITINGGTRRAVTITDPAAVVAAISGQSVSVGSLTATGVTVNGTSAFVAGAEDVAATFLSTDTACRIEFGDNSTTGSTRPSIGAVANSLSFSNGSTENWRINSSGDFLPISDAVKDIGSPSLQVDNIYTANSVTVSDERRKNMIGNADKLIELMLTLDPVIFSYKDRVIPAEQKTITIHKTKTKTRDLKKIEIVDGNAVLIKSGVEVYEEEIYDEYPLINEDGTPVLGDDGSQIIHKIPVMEDVKIDIQESVVKHGRPHTGFMAQDVKSKMDKLGIKDWAGYAYDDVEDIHMLRLNEFISPILATVQHLKSEIELLKKGG